MHIATIQPTELNIEIFITVLGLIELTYIKTEIWYSIILADSKNESENQYLTSKWRKLTIVNSNLRFFNFAFLLVRYSNRIKILALE